jgi:putative membrane protein
MLNLASLFIAITALLHAFFFKLESLDFMKPRTLQRFQLTPQDASVVKIWAFNQGFYNLFLACGLAYALDLLHGGHPVEGKVLAQFILLAITGAGLVLGFSAPQKKVAAAVQALPALIGFVLTLLL